jgi:hypothetical protein
MPRRHEVCEACQLQLGDHDLSHIRYGELSETFGFSLDYRIATQVIESLRRQTLEAFEAMLILMREQPFAFMDILQVDPDAEYLRAFPRKAGSTPTKEKAINNSIYQIDGAFIGNTLQSGIENITKYGLSWNHFDEAIWLESNMMKYGLTREREDLLRGFIDLDGYIDSFSRKIVDNAISQNWLALRTQYMEKHRLSQPHITVLNSYSHALVCLMNDSGWFDFDVYERILANKGFNRDWEEDVDIRKLLVHLGYHFEKGE